MEDPLERKTHSSILAWEILWTEEPDGLQSVKESDMTQQFNNNNKSMSRGKRKNPTIHAGAISSHNKVTFQYHYLISVLQKHL